MYKQKKTEGLQQLLLTFFLFLSVINAQSQNSFPTCPSDILDSTTGSKTGITYTISPNTTNSSTHSYSYGFTGATSGSGSITGSKMDTFVSNNTMWSFGSGSDFNVGTTEVTIKEFVDCPDCDLGYKVFAVCTFKVVIVKESFPGCVDDNLVLWLKPESGITSVSGEVSSWKSQSNNGITLKAISTTYTPALVSANGSTSMNFHNYIDFNKQDALRYPGSPFTSASDPGTVYVVTNLTDVANSKLIGFEVTSGNTNMDEPHLGVYNGKSFSYHTDATPAGFLGGMTLASGETRIMGYDWNASNRAIYVDGKLNYRRTHSGFTAGQFYTTIGDYGDNATDNNIAEVIAFNRYLNATERQTIVSYLAIKYGVTLNQVIATNYLASDGSTVVWSASTAKNFNQDVAGIGRDDCSGLYQKQSRSSNGDVVTVGIDSIMASNSANTGSIANDKRYMIWGNNGESVLRTAAKCVNLNSGADLRLARVWLVEENAGDVGSGQVQMDISTMGLTLTSATDFHLLVSNDGSNFSSSTSISATSISGNIVTFSSVNFKDGEYFTLGFKDNISPTLSCSYSRVVPLNDRYCWVTAADLTIEAKDECGILSITNNLPSNYRILSGQNRTVTFTVTDSNNNVTTCTQAIYPRDLNGPKLDCPRDTIIYADSGLCQTHLELEQPYVRDNCDGVIAPRALNFDGENDIVYVPSSSINTSTTQLYKTVEVHFRVTDKSISSHKQMIWDEGANANGMNIYVYDGKVYAGGYYWNGTAGTGNWISSANISDDKWHHIAITYSGYGSFMRVYLDGTYIGYKYMYGTSQNRYFPVHNTWNSIGAMYNSAVFHDGTETGIGNYFKGDIDELRIWSSLRSSAEISGNRNRPLIGNETGLIQYYTINGTACGNNASKDSVVYDITGSAVHGLARNFSFDGSKGCLSNYTKGAPISKITFTNDFTGTYNASGTYTLGKTVVKWEATDLSGNKTTCYQTVTVLDSQAPEFKVSNDIVVSADSGLCSAILSYKLPSVVDNCGTEVIKGNDRYDYTGEPQLFIVPKHVSSLNINAYGGAGGNVYYYNGNPGAGGGQTTGTIDVNEGDSIWIYVGGKGGSGTYSAAGAGGYNGGGQGYTNGAYLATGGGGGASDIRIGGNTLNDRILVAGGGGGAGIDYCYRALGGGYGGNSFGGTGQYSSGCNGVARQLNSGGRGGTSTRAGKGGIFVNGGNSFYAVDGSFGYGGTAQTQANGAGGYLGGGGGAGWYGGGAGITGGGGGGSGYYHSSVYNPGGKPRVSGGDGIVIITYTQLKVLITQIEGISPGDTFPIGLTTNTFVAQDFGGNKDTVSFDVTVQDLVSPKLQVIANQIRNNTSGNCNYITDTTEFDLVSYSDNCGIDKIWNDKNNLTTLVGELFTLGETKVVWFVKDVYGNISKDSFMVTVNDTEDPTITCVGNQTKVADNGVCTYTVSGTEFDPSSTNDNCSIASVTNDHNSSSSLKDAVFSLGSTTVTWTITDGSGNTETCSYNVVVTDDQDPTITCIGNQSKVADNGVCTYTVSGTEFDPTATNDNCSIASVTNDHNSSSSLKDAVFSLGSTTVTWTITDGSGNIETCSYNVVVTDDQDPTITCIGNQTKVADNGVCTYTVSGTEFDPTATNDNCSIASVRNDHNSSSSLKDAVFSLGSTTVTWTITDGSGNIETCSYNVVVTDDQDPTITCVGNQTKVADNGVCTYTVSGTEFDPTATNDNCSIASLTNDYDSSSSLDGAVFSLGSTTVTWTIIDGSGNTETCSYNVVVTDDQDPTISCVGDQTKSTSGACNYKTSGTEFDPSSTNDNCSIASVKNDHNNSASLAGAVFNPGSTTVTWTITDGSGNTETCSYDVKVILPEIDIIGNSLSIDNGDNTPAMSDYTNFGDTFPNSNVIYTYTIENNGTDELNVSSIYMSGTNSSDFTVGGLSLPASIASSSSKTFTVTFRSSTLGVKDATANIISDDCNNSSYSFDVTGEVSCTNPLFTSCPSDITQSSDVNKCTAVVTYSTTITGVPTPTLSYEFRGATSTSGSGNGSGSIFKLGTTVVQIIATNSCESDTCSFSVTVEDDQKPTISCVGNQTKVADYGVCTYTVSGTEFDPSSTNDNCSIASVTNDHNSSSSLKDAVFSLGSTTVTWTITDGSGNTETCSYNVVVTDDQDPTITCIGNQSKVADNGVCTYTVSGTEFDPTATNDNCSIASVTNDYNSSSSLDGAVFSLGSTTVTWTITDGSGNAETCSYNVVVTDDQKPTISCVGNQSKVADNGVCTYTVSGTEFDPTATSDNCSIASVTNDFNSSSSLDDAVFSLGSTTVTWTITDGSGNAETCSYDVVVTDDQKPTISCVGNQSKVADNGVCTYTVSGTEFDPKATSDNCSIASVTNDFNSSSSLDDAVFSLGSTTVTWTITDGSGNAETCSHNVVVTDDQKPVATCKNATITLLSGAASITTSDINLSSSDNCSIASFDLDDYSFTCLDVGKNTVTLNVTDGSGNTNSCQATVNVIGVIPTVTINESEMPDFCQGGFITLTAQPDSGQYFSYSWSTGSSSQSIDINSSNDYIVVVTNNYGCSVEDTANVNYTIHEHRSSYSLLAINEVKLDKTSSVQSGGVGVISNKGKAEVKESSTVTSSSTFVKANDIKTSKSGAVTSKIDSSADIELPNFAYNPYCLGCKSSKGSDRECRKACNKKYHKYCTSSCSSSTHSHCDKSCKNRKHDHCDDGDCVSVSNIYVGNNKTVILGDSVYGKVSIGKNSTVTFTSPRLYITDLKTSDDVTVKFTNCTEISLCDKLDLKKDNQFNPTGKTLVVYAEEEVKVDRNSTVNASIYTLKDIKVDGKKNDETEMKGLYIATKISSSYTNWNWDTICNECQNSMNKFNQPIVEDLDGLENANAIKLMVYPNPNQGEFGVDVYSIDDGTVSVVVYDQIGRLVFSSGELELVGPTYIPIKIDSLSTSTYYVRTIVNGKSYVRPIIITLF